MRGLAFDPSSGEIAILEVPLPHCAHGHILVRSAFSLISTGTELSKIDLASKSLIDKARERPDQVQKVLEMARSEGVVATFRKVRERLATPQPLGYSLSGTVEAVGDGCHGFRVGMPVACGGATACHAEMVSIPRNLAVQVPDGVVLADAAFATVASVALHGIRTGGISLGDRVLVIGLGLVGQLAVRLCVAAGAHVFAVDPRHDRAALAASSGADIAETSLDASTVSQVIDWSAGRGADVVLITAGGGDNQPLVLGGNAARDRARVVVVGALDLNIPRASFFEKELNLIVSRSYGPGRYDPAFEQKGLEYPVGFVPWTERRNMEEILNLLASGALSFEGIPGESFPFEQAAEGYALLAGKSGASPIAVVLDYSGSQRHQRPVTGRRGLVPAGRSANVPPHKARPLNVTFIGMGNFASAYRVPAVKAVAGAHLSHVVTSSPLMAETARKRAGFRTAGTSIDAALSDPETEVVPIATRHDTHARFAEAALVANKAVFVEKPLALTPGELDRVATAVRATQGRLMVGFNRRFAPATAWALEALGRNRADLRLLCRVNAGPLPERHWLLDPEIGGGRLLGEVCHFLDFACHVAGSAPTEVEAHVLDEGRHLAGNQDYRIGVRFENGATAAIDYFSGGDASLPKERIEIHRSGVSIVIDDFRSAALHRAGKRTGKRWAVRDKGYRAEMAAFLGAVRTGGPTPIPEEESILSTALTLAASRSATEGRSLRRAEW
jgi:predicted dehydrogenase/threonine dehydrogenase-like Zn-dependent dehydrogenase